MNLKTFKIISLSLILSSTIGYGIANNILHNSANNINAAGPDSVKMDFGNVQNKIPATTSKGTKLIIDVTFVDKNNNTWIGTNNGLYLQTSKTGPFVMQGKESSAFRGQPITAIYQDSEGVMWFASRPADNATSIQQAWYLKPTSSTNAADNFIQVQMSLSIYGVETISSWNGNMLGIDPGTHPGIIFMGMNYSDVMIQAPDGSYSAKDFTLLGIPSMSTSNTHFINSYTSSTKWVIWVTTSQGLYFANQDSTLVRPFTQYTNYTNTGIAQNSIITSYVVDSDGRLILSGIESGTNYSTIWVKTDGSIDNTSTATFSKYYITYPDGTYAINTRGQAIANVSLAQDSTHHRLFVGSNAWDGGNPENYSSLFVINNTQNLPYTAHEVILQNPTSEEYSAWNLQTAISGIALDKEGNPSFGSTISNVFWQFPKIYSNNSPSGLSGATIAGITVAAIVLASLVSYGFYKAYLKNKRTLNLKNKNN